LLTSATLRRAAIAMLFTAAVAADATAAQVTSSCYDIRAGKDISKLTGGKPGVRTLSDAQLRVLMIGAKFRAIGDNCQINDVTGSAEWTFSPATDGSVDVEFICHVPNAVFERETRGQWWIDDNQFCVDAKAKANKYTVPDPLHSDFIAKDYRGTVVWDIKILSHTEFSDRKELVTALKEALTDRPEAASIESPSDDDARR